MDNAGRKYPNIRAGSGRNHTVFLRNLMIAALLCLAYLLGKHFQAAHTLFQNPAAKVNGLRRK